MKNYVEPLKAAGSSSLSSLAEQLQQLRTAVETLSDHVTQSQSVSALLFPSLEQLARRVGDLEANSVSGHSVEQLRNEMSRLYLATQQKERLLALNMAEVKNLRRQVMTLETTLGGSAPSSGR
jgi:Mg2+ and Co2+ transporter CorA